MKNERPLSVSPLTNVSLQPMVRNVLSVLRMLASRLLAAATTASLAFAKPSRSVFAPRKNSPLNAVYHSTKQQFDLLALLP
jgi:hypothetical protein